MLNCKVKYTTQSRHNPIITFKKQQSGVIDKLAFNLIWPIANIFSMVSCLLWFHKRIMAGAS